MESQKVGRLPQLNPNAYPWYIRFLFAKQKRRFGHILNPMFFWGRSGPLAWAMVLFFAAIDRASSPISKELRALLTVRVSQINSCHFCIDINSMFLLNSSSSNEKLEKLSQWKESIVFSEKECAALSYAEAMTDSRLSVSDEVFLNLRKHFSDVEIIELTGLIAYQNLSSKFNNALDIKPQGFCKSPA